MMSKWFRRLVRRQTLAVLLTLAVCGGTVDFGHAGLDDPGCNPVLVVHDHSAHRLKAGTHGSGAPADHCALCHLLRVFHTALSSQSHAAEVVLTAEAGRAADNAPVVPIVAFGVPSRAPPAVAL